MLKGATLLVEMLNHVIDLITILFRAKVDDVINGIEVSIWRVLVCAEGEMIIA